MGMAHRVNAAGLRVWFDGCQLLPEYLLRSADFLQQALAGQGQIHGQ